MAVTDLDKLVKYYHENKIAHVYLIETNNLNNCLNDLKKTIKKLFCPNKYEENCNKCNICNLIDQNYLPSLKIIEPLGSNIKKEQILELKKTFSSIPIYTKNNIYIIKNAEKMNASSANTMLKFLEEPEENILGFFVTNNLNNVISTIKSRCEIIKVFYDNHELDIKTVDNPDNSKYLEIAKTYIYKLEVEKKDSIMYNRNVLLNELSEREDVKKVFHIMVIIYNESLNKLLNLNNEFAKFSDLDYLLKLNYDDVLKRLKLLNNFLDNLNSNANLELLLDKYVIELSDRNE